jgi:dTMP kinase
VKPKIICFAGLDGSGKTTQAKLLHSWLTKMGHESEFVRFYTEPTKAESAEIIKKSTQYLVENQLTLSLPAIRMLKESFLVEMKLKKAILPALLEGKSIVIDRYIETFDAHSAIFGKKENWVRMINQEIPKPDLYFFLDVPPETCLSRITRSGRRVSDHESIELLSKARTYYLEHKDAYSFIVIDGMGALEEVSEEIKKYIVSA